MRHGSLFSGIGGFDLAAAWMGWENVFQCEKEPFCRHVLQHYWPNAKLYEDVRSFEAEQYRDRIDVLSGGFPCQPFSSAGKRKGTGDDRYLWPEMYRIIGAIRPRWIIGENVFGFLNWGRGMVFEQVQADLEAEGYEVWSFVLPAAGVGAPHRRDRIWIVAHSHSDEPKAGFGVEKQQQKTTAGWGLMVDVSNPDGDKRCQGRLYEVVENTAKTQPFSDIAWDFRNPWQDFPAESPLCTRNDGIPAGLDGITFPKWRDGSIKAAGNAIVPQLAWELFKVIDRMEKRRV